MIPRFRHWHVQMQRKMLQQFLQPSIIDMKITNEPTQHDMIYLENLNRCDERGKLASIMAIPKNADKVISVPING